MATDETLYPLFVYLYDTNGNYAEPIRINNSVELAEIFQKQIREAMWEKREVRITDTGDLLCFHAQDGCILWDGTRHYEPGKNRVV